MRPEILATHIATTIRGLVEPVHRTLRDQQAEIHELKHALAALEAQTQRQSAALDALRDENKTLGQFIADTQQRTLSPDPPHGTTH